MYRNRAVFLSIFAGAILVAGCQHNRPAPVPMTAQPYPSGNGALTPVPFPGAGSSIAPQPLPPGSLVQPPSTPEPPTTLPGGTTDPLLPRSNYQTGPNGIESWRSMPNGVHLGGPQPVGPQQNHEQLGMAKEGEHLRGAMSPDQNTGTKPGNGSAKSNLYEPPSMPVGIPQFSIIKDGVSAGLRPLLDGGLDWLQARNYRTVLHLTTPGQDNSADQKQVEKRGMTYLQLEISPEKLNQASYRRFTEIVSDKSRYPLFIYDEDGAYTGAMCYLYFRLEENLEPDVARVRAGSLGLRENRDAVHRNMWLAVQAFMGQQQHQSPVTALGNSE